MIRIGVSKIIIATFLVCLICTGWVMALTSNLRMTIKQDRLFKTAKEHESLEIYQSAVHNLEKAITYQTPQTEDIYKYLARVYKKMNYKREYIETLGKIISLNTLDPDVYYELAIYYYDNYKYHDSLKILKSGIEKLGDSKLVDFYEQIRYKTYFLFCYFDSVGHFNNGVAPVLQNSKWGYVDKKGNIIIDFKFEKATNFSNGEALVINNGKTAIINKQGFNTKVAGFIAEDIKGLSDGIGGVKIADHWYLINNDFNITESSWTNISRNYNKMVAVTTKDKWGVRYIGGEIILDYSYDDLVLTEHEFCFVNDISFIKNSDAYQLINIDGALVSNKKWENAKAFNNKVGYAAVKLNNKWGFVNKIGEEVLPFVWENARSFSYGVAAVKINGKWGYINRLGEVVIGAVFDEAMSFNEGLAAVKVDDSWRFLGLEEYRATSNLLLESLGG